MSCSRAFMDWLRCVRNSATRKARLWRLYLQGQSCVDNETRARQRKVKLRYIYRLKTLSLLGAQCVCCGETDPAMLSIDHINGGGEFERKFSTGVEYFQRMLNHLKARELFRVLCLNCPHALNVYGYCTHHQETRPTVASELERAQRKRAELLECNQDKLVA